jgi:hypothetical protein
VRLTELEPQFAKIIEPNRLYRMVDAVGEADGIQFVCPECFRKLGKREGAHSIICWRPQVPLTEHIGPGRWELSGTNFDNLTLTGVPTSSVKLDGPGGCKAHFHVVNGEIQFCDDSGK